MRFVVVCALLSLASASSVFAQTDAVGVQTVEVDPLPRRTTLSWGVGSSVGWLGVQAEQHLWRQRLSVFGAAGYLPQENIGDTKGVAYAGGLRLFTPGATHRAFVELGIMPVSFERECFNSCEMYYGTGLQGGYHFVSRRGITAWGSLGFGTSGDIPADEQTVLILGVGVGYTWRR